MSRRLGEVLVAAGKISEAQLHRALTAQLVFGGHLGSSLLELGYLDEATLGETLSHMFGVPYADHGALSAVPYAVIRSLPARLVEKHKVVPLRLEGRTLHMAMIDPKNILALDEISFVTGYRIVPWVSPEARILQALDKYYNLPRPPRFVTLSRELGKLESARDRLRPLESRRAPTREAALAARAASAGPSGQGRETAAAMRPPKEIPPDPWEKYGYGRSWQEVAEAIDELSGDDGDTRPAEEADTRPQPRAGGTGSAGGPLSPLSVMTASRRLADAASVEEVVSTMLAYASGRLARAAWFAVKGGQCAGWAGRGKGINETAIRAASFPAAGRDAALFSLVPDGVSHFLGPVGQHPWAASFYARLGIPAPRTALLVPVPVKGRVAAYLYGDGADQEILAIDLPSLLSVAGRAGFALQILILRNKILSV
ncbi:MAG TPA: hypothetical protein VJV23_17010 [Candidatus Polarisedimenticolia bacterium]|nr:hypothetical protein [Candidatus Polarisedimenticolia bacterium]